MSTNVSLLIFPTVLYVIASIATVFLNFLIVFYRYIQCMHQKLYHLSPPDYEEFASVVRAARAAFNFTPDGHSQFKEWLQSIKR